MTPAEHYRRAEELLVAGDDRLTALVHAVLATATFAHRRAYPPDWPDPPPADPRVRPEPTLVRPLADQPRPRWWRRS